MSILGNYTDFIVEKYENFPQSRYLTLIVLRKAESEMIFRTEGSGEGLARDTVHAGLDDRDPISRVTISKRKQTAVERRTGRELLRQHNLLFYTGDATEENICALNRNKPCAQCADCMIYGYAVGGGGAQKSRVITDDAFSILPTKPSRQSEHLTHSMIIIRCAIRLLDSHPQAFRKMSTLSRKRCSLICRRSRI